MPSQSHLGNAQGIGPLIEIPARFIVYLLFNSCAANAATFGADGQHSLLLLHENHQITLRI